MACDQPKFRSGIGAPRLLAPLVARDDTLEEMQCARDSDEARTAPEQDDILKEGGQSQPESCRDAGGNSGCRAYGTRAHCATYPALKRWAPLSRLRRWIEGHSHDSHKVGHGFKATVTFRRQPPAAERHR